LNARRLTADEGITGKDAEAADDERSQANAYAAALEDEWRVASSQPR
jgi:hypothetical protein